jgi:putative membrane protein
MTVWQVLSTTWNWEPSVLLGCQVLILAYMIVLRFRLPKRALFYLAGVLILLLDLVSPLDMLAHTYLFSAHMVQHLILVLVVPPLLLLGLPAQLMQRILCLPGLNRLERVLSRPIVAWFLGVGTLWLWHVPFLYNMALEILGLHVAEHLSFLVTATIFWWPVLGPLPGRRLPPLMAIIYLFTAGVANSLLGIILTFAPPGLYPAYLNPIDWYGLLPLLRTDWGISPAVDQQLGGLLMWIPGGLIILCAILGILAYWYNDTSDADIVNYM